MSDYNTTGLRGPVDDRASDWFKLTKAVGSDKAGGAAALSASANMLRSPVRNYARALRHERQ